LPNRRRRARVTLSGATRTGRGLVLDRQRTSRGLRRASRRRPRSSFFDDSTSSRSASVRPVRSVSTRHQHSNPHRRSSSTRSRGIPPPARRGSPVSKSKKPSNTAGAPLRSGSPSRASTRMRHDVPERTSSALRGARPRPPRRERRSRTKPLRSRGARRRSSRCGRSPRGAPASGRAGACCGRACCGRGGPRRLPPRCRLRCGRGSSGTRSVSHDLAR